MQSVANLQCTVAMDSYGAARASLRAMYKAAVSKSS